jgi:hypothetical protein
MHAIFVSRMVRSVEALDWVERGRPLADTTSARRDADPQGADGAVHRVSSRACQDTAKLE